MRDSKILIVIPARGGSKGIPRKNLRYFNEKPLIQYAIQLGLDYYPLVTSDDEEILTISSQMGANIHKRPNILATDEATLEAVILDALISTCKIDWKAVVTIQPTSPLLSKKSLSLGLKLFLNSDYSTLISVVDNTHLRWGYDKYNNPKKLYNERLNRQYLPKEYKETGSFVICSVNQLIENKVRFGDNVGFYEIPYEESIDIDTYNDWKIAEVLSSKKKKLYFITKGNNEIGTGHIFNCLTLASIFGSYESVFYIPEMDKNFSSIITSRNYKVLIFNQNISDFKIDDAKALIVDYLDTDFEFINKLKSKFDCPIISFENSGSGTHICDLVFNPIYKPNSNKKIFKNSGPEYFILRDEFLLSEKIKFRLNIKRILIAYGGTDPCDLTLKTLEGIYKECLNFSIEIIVLLGKPYEKRMEIEKLYPRSTVVQNVYSVSNLMSICDLAFTSSGRTSFELTYLNVPSIITAQNEREEIHFFSNSDFHIYLGSGKEVSYLDYRNNLLEIINDMNLRKNIYNKLKQLNMGSGLENTINKIKRLL